MSEAHILVVDDEKDIRETVREILLDEGYEVSVAESGEAARKARQSKRPDVILLDIWMPDLDGISLLKEWSSGQELEAPVIMISGHGTVETAVEATRLGAYDFLEKPLSMAKLLLTVKRALEAARLQRENVGLRRRARTVTEPLGKSPAIQNLKEQIRRIAQTDAWVLIRGEPGSGKKVCARYLHANSARAGGPFQEVGVGSINKLSAAQELFGVEEGGKVHYGRLESANGGTLYLDEITDMDADLQAKLLGALQSGSFLRVNGSEPVQLDVRIIAATQADIDQELQEKRFREDLYYQLNVVPLRVLPLREHAEDVPDLLNYYVDEFVRIDNLAYRQFSIGAQNRLRNYPWPGNIRELKNLVQRLLILGAGPVISAEEVEAALSSQPRQSGLQSITHQFDMPLRQAREQFEKAYLDYHLQKSGGSVSHVAKIAGIERTHLYRKLKALGINPKE